MAKRTIQETRTLYQNGELSPQDIITECMNVLALREPDVHAYVDVFSGLEKRAEEAQKTLEQKGGEAPLLTGIPIAMKGNILVNGERATASSKILENYIAPYDATVTARLRAAGAIFVGATNMDEFAMGSSTENSAFGPTKNPHDISRVPGGSSGGSAAAVAMESALASLGTDTGGSVRGPASFCGLVGLKPTYGAVSRYGLIAMGSSLDQAGPLTHTVGDAELIFNVIRGKDQYDATSWDEGVYPEVSVKEVYRIGVPYAFLEGLAPDVRALFDAALAKLTAEGYTIVDISLPYMKEGLAADYIVMPAEVSSNLARFDGVRFGLHVPGDTLLDDYRKTRALGFGAEVKRRILLGTYVLSSGYYDAYYGTAERVRDRMREELAQNFENVDVILTPTTPTPAWKFGEKADPLSMYLEDIYTVGANLTGVPAISIPAGTVTRDTVHLHIGIQAMAPHNGEKRLFDIAKRYRGE
jgi:aspartyl-tRNA(Asn)/glutamyl-tRNA(Gln) amidotransferase subunit A